MNPTGHRPTNRRRIGRAVRLLGLLGLLGLASLAGAQHPSGDKPDPAALNSHENFVRLLDQRHEDTFQELLQAYDTQAAREPQNVNLGIERCRFLQVALWHEEQQTNPKQAEAEQCLSDLVYRFSEDPRVRLFQLEGLYGKSAIEVARGLYERGLQDWTDAQKSRLYTELSQAYQVEERTDEAVRFAQMALQADPEADTTLFLAQNWVNQGFPDAARRLLLSRLDAPAEAWVLRRKAQLLLDLEAPEAALQVLEKLKTLDPPESPDPLFLAHTLEALGQIDKARAQFQQAIARRPADQDVLRQAFRFELEHGDQTTATKAYRALRDPSYTADPIARNRLGLSLRFPLAPWQSRDLWGLAGLAGLLLLFAGLMPALWILPAHYVGLLRRERRRTRNLLDPRTEEPHPWGLRQAWTASAILLLAQFFGYYCFDPSAARALGWRTTESTDTSFSNTDVVGLFLTVAGVSTVGVLLLLRRCRLPFLEPGQWTWGKAISAAFLWAWVLRLMAHFYLRNMPHLSVLGSELLRPLFVEMNPVAVLLLTGLLVPWYEEVVFRGALHGAFRKHLPDFWANLLQSVLFSLAHGEPVLFVYYVAFGLVAGRLQRLSRGLLAPFALHAFNNLLAALAYYLLIAIR